MKYGFKDVFDVKVYSADGLAFEIDTMKDMSIEHRDGSNFIVIHDALLDISLFLDVFGGKYDNKFLRLVGHTYFREATTGIDRQVELTLTACKMRTYGLEMSLEEVSVPYMEFEFTSKDAYGFVNLNLKV